MGADLVTKASYKAYAGISSNNSDAVIDSLIPKVSALVKTLCRRTFVDYVDVAKVELSDGGYKNIYVEEYPIINVVSLAYSTDYGSTYTDLTLYKEYAVHKLTDSLVCISPTVFPEAVNGYKITYKAGYASVPADLQLAIFDLLTYYIKNDSAIHSNKAPGANSVQIEYVTTTNLPAHIKRVLDLYTANYN